MRREGCPPTPGTLPGSLRSAECQTTLAAISVSNLERVDPYLNLCRRRDAGVDVVDQRGREGHHSRARGIERLPDLLYLLDEDGHLPMQSAASSTALRELRNP